MPVADSIVFIVGSPRSGTTLLGNLLNNHHLIAEWYEPYYLWERFFPVPDQDVWDRRLLTEEVIMKIRNEFSLYRKKSGRPIIVDKSPYHSFNIDIIHEIFPEAKFIHILRDGRDVTLSINKEWEKRANIVENKDIISLLKLAFNMLKRQPYLRYRLMAILYELKTNINFTTTFNPNKILNKSRWKGEKGWGPRFENWYHFYKSHSVLEFNAMQWVKSVDSVIMGWRKIPDDNKIQVNYEELIQYPEESLLSIFNLLGVVNPNDFFEGISDINKLNYNKWRKEFSYNEINELDPVLSPMLNSLGYIDKYSW